MKEKFFNLFNENPSLISHCPVCNVRFNPLEARVLKEEDYTHLIYIRCRQCQASILALVTASALGLSSVGLITDLSGDDLLKFKQAKPVSFDDVIEAHLFLTKEKVLTSHLP